MAERNEDWWPRDPYGYVFLARVVEKLGIALHSDWTGTEAGTEDIDPLPRSLKDATHFDRQKADVLLNQSRLNPGILDFLAGCGAREFSDEDWKIAHQLAQSLHNQRQPALRRLQATQSEIVSRNEAGQLELRIQSRNGGPWRDFQRDWWNTDEWRSHISRCRIDPNYPNGRPSWNREDNDHWIFATSESVEKLLRRLRGTKPQPQQKPTSEAELVDFMESYDGPQTEPALTNALKKAGKKVTRARIRKVLPARRRGRPNNPPK